MKETVPPKQRTPSCRLAVAAIALCAALAAAAPASAGTERLSRAQATFLGFANGGVSKAGLWWDGRRHWYRDRLYSHKRYPLATVWSAFPLFETLDAVAIADPSPAHLKAVANFAKGAERYWNGNLKPVPGYAPYPGDRSAHERTWFDDNGWWGIGFYDAYRATHDKRFLADAKRALVFINNAGWDRGGGGLWWSTLHEHKAGESLAAGTFLAASLYHETGDAYYLAVAQKFIGWADSRFTNGDGLYDRREDDETPMPYVQGPMFAAFAALCEATGDSDWCNRAETLAQASVKRFPVLDMGPQYDAIYLRSLLELYRVDHDPRWYGIVQDNAGKALDGAQDSRGLFLRGWDGSAIGALGIAPNMLQTHAATASVFAWMATAPPPGS